MAKDYAAPVSRTLLRRVGYLAGALLVLLLPVASRGGDAAAPTAEQVAFFETRIRPLLASSCYECHGPEKQRGGLRLDSRSALLQGGDSGAAVELEHPEASLLLTAVNYEGLEMPPSGRLAAEDIEVLTDWIKMGAPWPGSDEPSAPVVRARERELSEEDRQWWSFQPLAAVTPPVIQDPWLRNPIDAFVLERLQAAGLAPAPAAERRALVRRAYFDLWGLPPSAADIDGFLADTRPDAFARLVDRLLDDPRYGQRWARHWLDLVRFAESDGYKQDALRPQAWRYRDYVIRSLNSDKPYDRFVLEQLAGDELAPDDPDALIATGLLRHTIYEYNQRDVRTQWDYMVTEVTDVTADVFLGMGLGCARCHDHKFDPLLQRDYFALRAFFEPLLPRDDLPLASAEEIAAHQQQQLKWEEATKEIRAALEALEAPHRPAAIKAAIDKFPKDIRPMLTKSPAERQPLEQQLAELAGRQITVELATIGDKLKGDEKRRWQELKKQLAAFDPLKPAELPTSLSVTDVGPVAPPTVIPGDRDEQPIEPAFLTVLGLPSPAIAPPDHQSQTTGRRLALARWIANPENPLSTRVIVNRVWQYHFGEGLVRTSSDFGHLGELPTHPELLDWLTRYFLDQGWSLKALHRLIMNSATYQQSAFAADMERARQSDPENRLLWHMPLRRLDAEQVRDAMLMVSGELAPCDGGPSAEWTVPMRSIFTRVMRNARDPLLDAFDVPDAFGSTSKRNVTTTPTQSLLMINSDVTLDRAKALAAQVAAQASTDTAQQLDYLYRRVYGRPASAAEIGAGTQFLLAAGPAATAASQANLRPADSPSPALVDLCHVLLNSNEFLYVE